MNIDFGTILEDTNIVTINEVLLFNVFYPFATEREAFIECLHHINCCDICQKSRYVMNFVEIYQAIINHAIGLRAFGETAEEATDYIKGALPGICNKVHIKFKADYARAIKEERSGR